MQGTKEEQGTRDGPGWPFAAMIVGIAVAFMLPTIIGALASTSCPIETKALVDKQ